MVTILKRIGGAGHSLPDTRRNATLYADSEMSWVRGILVTMPWLYFLPTAEFYIYEEAPR